MKEFKNLLSDLILQSIEIIAILSVGGGIIVYLFFPEVFLAIVQETGGITPILIAIGLYSLITKKRIKKAKKRLEKEGNIGYADYYCIYVSKKDEMKNDVLAILTAVIIVATAKIMNGRFDYSDIWQAGIALLGIYLTKKIYFKKQFSVFGKEESENTL